MYHSVNFYPYTDGSEGIHYGDKYKNTWEDWFLVPTSRPTIKPPSPKLMVMDIPGGNGFVDLTESLTGEVTYSARQGDLEFIVDNGHKDWTILYSEISNYLHGKRMKVVLEDDPGYYYRGRVSVNEWKSEPHNSKIVLSYILDPFKFELLDSLDDDWLWDPFNFETGIIRCTECDNILLFDDGSGLPSLYDIEGSSMPLTPSFQYFAVSDEANDIPGEIDPDILDLVNNRFVNINFKGRTYTLQASKKYPDNQWTRFSSIRITEGQNTFSVLPGGSEYFNCGYLRIKFRGGSL